MKFSCSFFLALAFLALACKTEIPKSDYADLDEAQKRQIAHALESMQVADGLEVSLFAAEPMVMNPTNIAVDALGRVWVCEALNYRLPYNDKFEKHEEGDRILMLEDTDGDGRADARTVFYQGPDLLAPLGIAVLGDKVYVSSSPTLQVFTDTDGDNRADIRDTLFITEGGRDHDHGLHSMTFGPDGRLYFNFGNEVHGLKDKKGNYILDQEGNPIHTNGKPYRQGMALRCNRDGSNVEVLGHNFRNPYELAVDAFGNVWQSDNDDDGNRGTHINFLLEYGNYGYTDEMTGAGWRTRRIGWDPEIPVRHWHQNDPGSIPVLRYNYAGSPTGLAFYEGHLLPEAFQNQMIHCEALKNEVRAYPVSVAGAGYTADSLVILKSKDQWFRPSDVAVAPDGSLLISDWYDGGVGGHRMEDAQQGRIYRVAPKTDHYQIGTPDLEDAEGLKAAFLSPNQDLFFQASRQLEAGSASDEILQALWKEGDDVARARSLWLLARKAEDPAAYIQAALQEEDERFRVLGIRLTRQLAPEQLTTVISFLIEDPSPAVRREAAIALRYIGTPEAAELWAGLARRYDGKDRWYLEALGLGSDKYPNMYLSAFDADMGENALDEAAKNIYWRMRSTGSIAKMAEFIKDPEVSEADAARYFRAFHFKPGEGRNETIAGLLELDHPLAAQINSYALSAIDAEYLAVNSALQARIKQLLPDLKGTPEWLEAVQKMSLKQELPALLAMYHETDDRALANEAVNTYMDLGGVQQVAEAFHSAENDQEKLAVIREYGAVQNDGLVRLWARLLDKDQKSFPVNNALVNALGNGWTGQHLLYDRVREGKLQGNLKTAAVLHLMRCWDPEVRAAAPTFLTSSEGKGGILPPVARLVEMKGNVASGKTVFTNICATCHKIGEEGTEFGPNLSQIGGKLAKGALYSAILYPSAGINFGYEGYLVKTKQGGVFSGYKEGETEEEITLRMMGGISQVISRQDISGIEPMDQSLMTANLQAIMEQQELVDLVEYLSGL
ncbi:MAG: PQQ-dependent sugar dehydrogenase, partial [Lewinella sp.]|nr:PQQ-dependent sugar dehydrogenase [Lewinella sp.]